MWSGGGSCQVLDPCEFPLDACSAHQPPAFAAHCSLPTQTPRQHVRGAQVPKKDRLGREISAAASAGLRRKAAAKRAAGPLGSPLQAGRATTPLSAAGRRLASSLRGHTAGGGGGGGGSADAQLRASYGGTPSAAARRRTGTPGFGTPAGTPAAAATPLRAGRPPAAAHGAARRLATGGGAGEQDAQTGTAKASLTDNLLNI